MEVLVNGKKIKDLNEAVVKLRKKIKVPISGVALYSLLEDARISKSKIFSLDKEVKKRGKIPIFVYRK